MKTNKQFKYYSNDLSEYLWTLQLCPVLKNTAQVCIHFALLIIYLNLRLLPGCLLWLFCFIFARTAEAENVPTSMKKDAFHCIPGFEPFSYFSQYSRLIKCLYIQHDRVHKEIILTEIFSAHLRPCFLRVLINCLSKVEGNSVLGWISAPSSIMDTHHSETWNQSYRLWTVLQMTTAAFMLISNGNFSSWEFKVRFKGLHDP